MSVCTQVYVDHNGDAGNEVELPWEPRYADAWVRLALRTIRVQAKSNIEGQKKHRAH
jgi:hypothetical protein